MQLNITAKGALREGIGHLEVIRLLDLGGGRVDADPEDVVVGAVLHHGGKLLDLASRRLQLQSYRNEQSALAAVEEIGRNQPGRRGGNRCFRREGEGPYQGRSGPSRVSSRRFRGKWRTGIGSPDLGRFSREAKWDAVEIVAAGKRAPGDEGEGRAKGWGSRRADAMRSLCCVDDDDLAVWARTSLSSSCRVVARVRTENLRSSKDPCR